MAGDLELPPLVGMSMGDPAGVGPEILVKAAASPGIGGKIRLLAFGDARVLEKAARAWAPGLRIAGAATSLEAEAGVLPVMDLANADPASFEPGKVQASCGKAAWESVRAATEAALAGRIDALATAPLNKESLRAAGIPHVGHTEMLGALSGVRDPLTMFETGRLRVFFLSRHVSLRDALSLVTEERLLDCIRRCAAALEAIGAGEGGLAVAGLNPHCGEHGLFGDEELRIIGPAVERARGEGLRVRGPVGADSVFHQAKEGLFSAVLSLYHDQGHIAAKTLDFEGTVSLTLGLPFIRSSVDHGTAFDIAWTGKASERGMKEAILAAARYSGSWKRHFA